EDTYKGQVDNPLSLNRYTYVHNNPQKYVDPSGHQVERGVGGFEGYSSQKAEYMHWAGVAAKKAYEQGIEPEDAVRMYVPTHLQEEVLSTAVVTFNTAVWVNHGDAPNLGLATPAVGVVAAGTIKNTGKSVTKATSKFTEPWIQKDTYKYITDKFGKNAAQKFVDAMENGVVGPKGQEGIKQLSKVEKKNGVIYTHEIKVLDNELGDYRIYGRFDKDRGQYIFDWFGKGKH
ncbi:wall-associated protein, partial [Brevibacillus formosus]